MLSRLLALPLALVGACNTDGTMVSYCGVNGDSKLQIDFTGKELIFTSAGVADQHFPIIPCADAIESCFLGEVSFVHPYVSTLAFNRNVISARPVDGKGFYIETRGNGTRTSYYIERANRFPKELTISHLADRKDEVLTLC